MQKVAIIGAGFSGLTAAYYLQKSGYSVEIFEKEKAPGGLIHSRLTSHGLVESAANAILFHPDFAKICAEIGVEILYPQAEAKQRYIFRGKARRWPLNFWESLCLLARIPSALLLRGCTWKSRAEESGESWSKYFFGHKATRYLFEPALQGIFASRLQAMSANLLHNAIFGKKKSSKQKRRILSVAPRGGMGEFLEKLAKYLEEHGVAIHYASHFSPREKFDYLLIATSVAGAASILRDYDSTIANALARVPMISVQSLTAFYPKSAGKLPGFGCLFPQDQGFMALGVLFNSYIFPYRSELHSETWIYSCTEECRSALLQDRLRLYKEDVTPLKVDATFWPEALPLYGKALDDFLSGPWQEKLREQNIFLHGNYLGKIGLTSILERSREFPEILMNVKKLAQTSAMSHLRGAESAVR